MPSHISWVWCITDCIYLFLSLTAFCVSISLAQKMALCLKNAHIARFKSSCWSWYCQNVLKIVEMFCVITTCSEHTIQCALHSQNVLNALCNCAFTILQGRTPHHMQDNSSWQVPCAYWAQVTCLTPHPSPCEGMLVFGSSLLNCEHILDLGQGIMFNPLVGVFFFF